MKNLLLILLACYCFYGAGHPMEAVEHMRAAFAWLTQPFYHGAP